MASPIPILENAVAQANRKNPDKVKTIDTLEQADIDEMFAFLAGNDILFNHAIPLFSKEFSKTNLKARMVRFVFIPAGPINFRGIRYNHMRDR